MAKQRAVDAKTAGSNPVIRPETPLRHPRVPVLLLTKELAENTENQAKTSQNRTISWGHLAGAKAGRQRPSYDPYLPGASRPRA